MSWKLERRSTGGYTVVFRKGRPGFWVRHGWRKGWVQSHREIEAAKRALGAAFHEALMPRLMFVRAK